jgi:stage V sporulation protein SpoVS
MNVHKHMEAIFVVALAVVGLGTMVIDGMPEATAGAHAPVIRDVAAAPVKAQGAAPVAMLCTSKAARRA